MPAYVVLLRGINVGGKNKLPMTELARLFAELGCGAVTTYIQSGNVLFEAAESEPASLGPGGVRRRTRRARRSAIRF